jgi:hypothetical protein
MNIELVAVVRKVRYAPNGQRSAVEMASLDLVYPDGQDCGVPLFVGGYEEASQLLMRAGVPSEALIERQGPFERNAEVRIPMVVEEAVVRDMGFNPREYQ